MTPKITGKKTESTASDSKAAPEAETGQPTPATTAQIISIPHEGWQGWLVLFGAFMNIFILDGIVYTFGSILPDMSRDMKVSDSLVALINSSAIAVYFLASPLASAFINRYGFRNCIMIGSVMSSFALFCSYFVTDYVALFVLYGPLAGFGYSFINMSSILVVGFYFEKLRSIAMSLATSGSSFGIMVIYPVNSYLIDLAGWRSTNLLHCGLLGMVFFLGMTYQPLLTLNITRTAETTDDPTHLPVDLLPSLMSTNTIKQTRTPSRAPSSSTPTITERLFCASSNANYPTAAEVIASGIDVLSLANQPGTSTAPPSKLTMTTSAPLGGVSRRQLKEVRSYVSQTSNVEGQPTIELYIHDEEETSRPKHCCWACCERMCHWEPHKPDARPLYRDDAFYQGKVEDLSAYPKSAVDTPESRTRTGLEYRMAVSRSVAVHDLRERRGVFTTAVRRVLVTMMDPTLLKRYSFLLMCLSGFLTYLGHLVPYVYLQDRNVKAGMDPKHGSFLVSAIGFSNAVGRILLGCLANKIEPLKMFSALYALAGLSTILSSVSYSVYFQYAYSCVYGFCLSSSCLRSVIIVSLYGLDKLTNAMGMMLIFLGLGNLVSTPMASVLKNTFGYEFAFIPAGVFITISGLILIPIKALALRNK